MKNQKLSEYQIVEILDNFKKGAPVIDLCLRHGISEFELNKWTLKYNVEAKSGLARIHELEEEINHLRIMYDELSDDHHELLMEIMDKKSDHNREKRKYEFDK
ncbi:transposase [bacterium AH-315-K03]|nr:transposase [bacterium AH-315-K03]